ILHPAGPPDGRWLARALYSWNPGFELKPGRERWGYGLAFSDSAMFLGKNRLVAQYGEARRGVTFNFKDSILVTPHLVADARWQSGTVLAGSYFEAGGGVSVRYLFRQNRYEAKRSSFEVLLQCKRGSFGANQIGYTGCPST